METTKLLHGDKTVLRPLTEQDVPRLTRWLFDPDILHWLQLSEDPPEYRTEAAVLERFQGMQADLGCEVWRIDTKDGQPIGQIDLVDIHPLHYRAEIHLCLGEKDHWSGGFGSDALRRLLRYTFQELGLRKISLIVDADNSRAIRCFEKCGFEREGRLKAHRLRYGQPIDMLAMAVLNQDLLQGD